MITITMPAWTNIFIIFMCIAYLVTQALGLYLWYLKWKYKKQFGEEWEGLFIRLVVIIYIDTYWSELCTAVNKQEKHGKRRYLE